MRTAIRVTIVCLALIWVGPAWSRAGTPVETLRKMAQNAAKGDLARAAQWFPRLVYIMTVLQAKPEPAGKADAKAVQMRRKYLAFIKVMLASMTAFTSVQTMTCAISTRATNKAEPLGLALIEVRHEYDKFLEAWRVYGRKMTPDDLKKLHSRLAERGNLVKADGKQYVRSLFIMVRLDPYTRTVFKKEYGWENKDLKDGDWITHHFNERSAGLSRWESLRSRYSCR